MGTMGARGSDFSAQYESTTETFIQRKSSIFEPFIYQLILHQLICSRTSSLACSTKSNMETIQLTKRGYSEQRSPTLNTVLMVEETLMNADGVITVAELKRKLPKQVMHQTLMLVIDYLEWSGKITFHDNKILWTFNPDSKLKNQGGQRVR